MARAQLQLLSAALLTAAPALLPAQQRPATPLAPVEVVATRVPQAPHDVPASIEVISGATLRARGAMALRDALALSAGINIAPGGDAGPATSVPEIWGLREADAYLLVVDNVPWGGAFNPAVSTLNLNDVERIEILRGPAPVTYGATSFVGVIHVVHKAATESSRALSFNGGSYGSAGGTFEWSGKLMDSWASRLTADFDRTGQKDDGTSAMKSHAMWRGSKTAGQNNWWLGGDFTMLTQEPGSPHPREGASLSASVPLDANHNPANAHADEVRFMASAGVDRPLGTATWTTMASWTISMQDDFRGFLTDVSNTNNNASGFKRELTINDLYADSHLIWPAKNDWRWMLGADVLFGSGEGKGSTFTYTAPLNGSSRANVTEPSVLSTEMEDERLFLGVYSSGEWKPNEKFSLSIGGRMNMTSETREETATNSRFSYNVGALYELWASGMDHFRVFANYRDTFKPAAVDFGLGDDDEEILKPETSTSYEAGFKWRGMDGLFGAELSYFNMDFKNLVTSSIVNGQPELQNIGATRFSGFELAADWNLMDSWWVRGTYSAHDPKFMDYVQEFGGTNTQLRGKQFEMSAKSLWSAGINGSPADGWTVYANTNFVGDRYLNKRNTAMAKGYTTFDAGLAWMNEKWGVRLDGRNLGDARDPVSESEIGDAQYYRMTAMSVRAGIMWKW